MGGTRRTLWLSLLFAALATSAGATPRITLVTPAGHDGLLICRLTTADLPSERIVSTLRSGLVSAVEFNLEVLQDGDRPVAGNRVMVRLSFDLWEEVYAVDLGGSETRLADLTALRDYLADLPPLPVASLDALDDATPAVIRAGLRLHTIAPDTRGRMEGMISGDRDDGGRHGDPGQEVLVNLGKLIRFFYKGGAQDDMDHTLESAPFLTRELTP
jgi:hypothetical protein